MKKILIIVALVLFIWLAPALYLYLFKGYDTCSHGWFYNSNEEREWKHAVLNADDHSRNKQKRLGLTEEEREAYLQNLLDSLDNNKPGGFYYPLFDL